jgi:hypothetical protein
MPFRTPSFFIWCVVLVLLSCSGESPAESAAANETFDLPAQELTAVGMTSEAAKSAIQDLGFDWVVMREDGVEYPAGPEIPGRFKLEIREGVVVRQVVDGVQPYIDVNAMDTLEAQDLIVSKGWTYRVTVIDGVRVVDDDSRVPSRYNLWVTTDGKVVFHEIDTVRLDEIWEPSVAN